MTLWPVAHQASLSTGFPRQEYWSGLPFLFPGNVPDPGIKPASPALQVDYLPLGPLGSPQITNRNIRNSQWGRFCPLLGHLMACENIFVVINYDVGFWHLAGRGQGLPRWCRGKESACQCRRRGFDPWLRKIPWRRKWQPTPVFLPGKSRGQRSLAGDSPWGCKEQEMTESLSTHKCG